jgi:hypothetical protein
MFLYIGTTQPEHFPNNHSHGTPGAKFAVAVGLGAVVGFERQWRNRLARLRTSTPVAPGAASVSFSRNSLRMTKPEPRAAQVAASDSQRRPDLPKEPKRTVAHYGRAAMAFGRDWRIADAGNLLYAADPGPLFWFTPGRNSR